jgi:hypothetical protein
MTQPGEINQAVGRAYQYVFVGALEAHIPAFSLSFHVHDAPEKTTFKGRDGRPFSFDFAGLFNHPWHQREVFGECKGYRSAGDLLQHFRHFVAKAYVTSCDQMRHRDDLFWYVTNVPFGCSEGSKIVEHAFIKSTLTDSVDAEIKAILGAGEIDDGFIRNLASRIGVFIFTDSYLKTSELVYKVAPGETMWTILKRLHGGSAPSEFGHVSQLVAHRNRLASPDRIRSGTRLRIQWQGLPKHLTDNLP